VAHRIACDVCYHLSEFWVGATHRVSLKTAGLSSLLGRYACGQAAGIGIQTTSLPYMTNAVVYKGFPARHGYIAYRAGTLAWFINVNMRP